MTDITKVLPCPFCGGQPEIWQYENKEWIVDCLNVTCEVSVGLKDDTLQTAVDKWNTRA